MLPLNFIFDMLLGHSTLLHAQGPLFSQSTNIYVTSLILHSFHIFILLKSRCPLRINGTLQLIGSDISF